MNTFVSVGSFQTDRAPRIRIVSQRRAVTTRAEVELPDPKGDVLMGLAKGDPVRILAGYRGGNLPMHEFTGTVDGWTPESYSVAVRAVGPELPLLTTRIVESFREEPAEAVARRVLAKTGLPLGRLEFPAEVLPHQVFSALPAFVCIRSLIATLENAHGHDLRRCALWLGANGLNFGDFEEPGDVPVIASAESLLSHQPAAAPGALAKVTSVFLPGLSHSRLVKLEDARRGINETFRAVEVVHELSGDGDRTIIAYGDEYGWA